MFKLFDDFKTHDDNQQPYSLRVERHTEIRDLHAGVDERGFSLRSIGNRFVFNTPSVKTFKLSMKYCYTFMQEYDPSFNIFFGYNTSLRCGYGLSFVYILGGGMKVSYIRINRMKIETVSSLMLPLYSICDEEITQLNISFDGESLTGDIDGHGFSFCAEETSGHLAIERKNFIGELIISELSLESEDDLPEEIILNEQTVEIPLTDGGDIPYLFSYEIKKIGDICYLNTALFGGTASRKVNREDRPGQYVAEIDVLTSPFVKLMCGERQLKFNIFNGEKMIADPNIFWECLKKHYGHPEFPIRGRFVIDDALICDELLISYGYEKLSCGGYSSQMGGPSEYIFTIGGELIYSGDALGESMFELFSPKDKFAVSLIPEGAYKREDIIAHLESNHYFHAGEDINFTACLRTKLNPEYFSVKAEIRDVYDSCTLKHLETEDELSKWKFGYSQISSSIASEPMELGVYRIVFTFYYGDSVYKCYDKVFEVFDKDSGVSPAVASGLPYIFSMPNEQKWLMRNSFDLWTPKASCDLGHYISCITDTPIEAETRRVWEVIKPFGREWFAWLSDRTVRDWSIESHPDVVKNSDYLYVPAKTEVFPLRNDLYLARTYQNPKFRKYLHEFMDLNPDIASKLTYKKTETLDYVTPPIFDESGKIPIYKDFTYEHLKNLMDTCHKEWMEFALGKLLDNFREQNKELKKINPSFKRTAYGPFNQYVTPALSYHTIKAFGNIPYETLSEEVYTGFAIFEDYPNTCAYQTYRGAFAVMTILLHCPHLRLYPEQYKGGGKKGGCIDGAVKFSHAPMGAHIMPPYFNTTHSFEFVFNTPRRTENGYEYWNTYGFHRPNYQPELMDCLVKDWKKALDFKPKKPLRTMAMITEYYEDEDIYDDSIINFHGHTNLYNVSEEAHGYIYECAREGGLNAPFALKAESLRLLSAEECDTLVLPTLRYVGEDVKNEIRRLYNEGVSLFAVSHIDGLEDIFGVKPDEKTEYISILSSSDGELEEIYPNDAHFRYSSDGAEVLVSADGSIPVLMKHGRAVLLNSAVSTLGHECFEGAAGKGRKNISTIMRNAVTKTLRDISEPLATGENVGITLFEDVNGKTNMLCIDYSEYTNDAKDSKLAVVRLNINVKEINTDREICSVRDSDGYIREIRFNIKVHEAVMFTMDDNSN